MSNQLLWRTILIWEIQILRQKSETTARNQELYITMATVGLMARGTHRYFSMMELDFECSSQ